MQKDRERGLGLWGWSVRGERDEAGVERAEATQAENCGRAPEGNGEPLKVPG